MKRSLIIFFLLFAICFTINCSENNGIEGNILIFGADKPIAGVNVEAYAKTDIKEQMDKSIKSNKTDSKGNFKFSGLIPGKKYKISIKDQNYTNIAKVVEAPAEGTRVLDKPIIAYPSPSERGVYIYNIKNLKMEKIQHTDKIVKLKKINWKTGVVLCGGALYVVDEDLNKACAEINRDSMVVLYGKNAKSLKDLKYLERIHFSIGQLHKITEKTIAGSYCEINIKTAWYLSLKDISTKKAGRDKIVDFNIDSPSFEKMVVTGELLVLPLENFPPGYYFFVTKFNDRWYPPSPELGIILKIV